MKIRDALYRIETAQEIGRLLAEDFNPDKFIDYVERAVAKARTSEFPGEVEATKHFLTQMAAKAEQEAAAFTPQQQSRVNLLLRPFVAQAEKAARQQVNDDDLPVPQAIEQSLEYRVPNSLLTAVVKRMNYLNVKRGDQNEAYYSLAMVMQADSADALENAFQALGLPYAMGKFKGYGADRFIPNWPLSKAQTEPMMLYYDDLQKKLKEYGFQPLNGVQESLMLEKAPPGEKAEHFIKKAKKDFKARYGKNWKKRLYATAWKLFGD